MLSGGEQDMNPGLSRTRACVEPTCTPGAEGLSDLPVRGEGGSILSTEPRMCSIWSRALPREEMNYMGPNLGPEQVEQGDGGSAHTLLSRDLLLILLPSAESL